MQSLFFPLMVLQCSHLIFFPYPFLTLHLTSSVSYYLIHLSWHNTQIFIITSLPCIVPIFFCISSCIILPPCLPYLSNPFHFPYPEAKPCPQHYLLSFTVIESFSLHYHPSLFLNSLSQTSFPHSSLFCFPEVQVSEDQCEVSDAENRVRVLFTPTIPHCGMAPIIGLSIRLKLLHTLPRRYVLLMVLLIVGKLVGIKFIKIAGLCCSNSSLHGDLSFHHCSEDLFFYTALHLCTFIYILIHSYLSSYLVKHLVS